MLHFVCHCLDDESSTVKSYQPGMESMILRTMRLSILLEKIVNGEDALKMRIFLKHLETSL